MNEPAGELEFEADPVAGPELAAFAACARAGSVHGAADALHLTQSAVTKRLQRLERHLGLQLLARSPQGVALTAAGRAVLPAALGALTALTDVRAAAAAHAGQTASELSLAASRTIGDFLLPGWLAEFGREHPGVHARVEVVNSPGVLERVRSRQATIGFVEGSDQLTGLTALTVATDEIVVVTDATHRWAARTSIAPAELAAEPYITREAGSGTRSVAEEALAAAGIRLAPALEVDSTQAVKQALRSGGFSLLSRVTVVDDVRAGRLFAAPVRGVPMVRELQACHDAATELEGAARQLWLWLGRRPGETASRGQPC